MNIIDIRNKKEYDKDHIPGSINVSYAKLIIHPDQYLKKNMDNYIVCSFGTKSRDVAQLLNNNDYKVLNIEGGYNHYRK